MSTTPKLLAPAPRFELDAAPPVTFSAIVNVPRGDDGLRDAIESLLTQTRPPEEILVAPTAVPRAELDRAIALGASVAIVDAGPGARNRAVGIATGRFVVGLDVDDVYLPGRLAAIEEAARARPDLEIITTGASLEVAGGPHLVPDVLQGFAVDDQRTAILQRSFVLQPALRRERLVVLGGFEESLGVDAQDWDAVLRLVLSGSAAGMVDAPLYRRRTLPPDERALARAVLPRHLDHPGLSPEEQRVLRRALEETEARPGPRGSPLLRPLRATLGRRPPPGAGGEPRDPSRPFVAANVSGFPLVAPPQVVSVAPREPAFSILIPAYNAVTTVGPAVESALAQTMAPAQVIVCDDGSTDGTVELLERFEPDIVLLRREHLGGPSARNACLAEATGTHVVPFDADDLLLPRLLEACRGALEVRPDLAVVTCDAYFATGGRIFDRYYRRTARFAVDDQRVAVLHQHFVFGFAATDRELARRIGGWDPRSLTGDTDFWVRAVLEGASVGLLAEPLAVYQLRAGSLSDDRGRSLREMVDIITRALDHPSLTEAERDAVRRDLLVKERLATVAELESALATNPRDARRRALAIARRSDGSFSPPARAAALATAAFPRAADRVHRLLDARAKISSIALRTRNW